MMRPGKAILSSRQKKQEARKQKEESRKQKEEEKKQKEDKKEEEKKRKEEEKKRKQEKSQEDQRRKVTEVLQKAQATQDDLEQRLRKSEAELTAAKRLYATAFGLSDVDARPSKLKKPDPFKAPASSFDSKLLSINHPFIDVTECPKHLMPSDNVVDGQFMEMMALHTAIKQLMDPTTLGRIQYKSVGSELGARILHALVLLNLKFLTVPSTGAEIWVGGRFSLRDAEQVSDEIRHEGDEADVAFDVELVKSDRYDLKGKVRDAESQEQVTVLIIECDWRGSPQKLYQASEYAIRAAIQNMIKNRFKPIYLHNWGDTVWRHGVLRPQHLAYVKGGQVVELRTVNGVLHRDEVMRAEAEAGAGGAEAGAGGAGAEAELFRSLDAKLEKATKVLNDEYMYPERFPDGQYVCGTIHLNTSPMVFPFSEQGLAGEAMVIFVNALLRTFIGDVALDYTKEHVDKIVATRKARHASQIERNMAPFFPAYYYLTKQVPSGVDLVS